MGRVPVTGFEEVGVHVERGRSVCVSEPTAHGSDRHSGGEQLCGVQVPQIVGTHASQSRPPADAGAGWPSGPSSVPAQKSRLSWGFRGAQSGSRTHDLRITSEIKTIHVVSFGTF